MKRKLLLVVLTIILLATSFIFVACDNADDDKSSIEHNFKESDICAHCGKSITSVAIDNYNMSATKNDHVQSYVIPRTNNTYDVYIKGKGEIKNYNSNSSPFNIDGYAIKCVYIQNGITFIGAHLFDSCPLVYISIPESVTQIGAYAFNNCNNLTNITIPSSTIFINNNAFNNCAGLLSVTIPDKVEHIGDYAFQNCINLANITIEGTLEIGTSAFDNTEYYNNANNWENKVLYINDCLIIAKSTIENCTVKTGTKIITDYAFFDCLSLESITIPSSITSIKGVPFYNCNLLTKVNYTGNIDQWASIDFDNALANPLHYAHNLYINNELVTSINLTTAPQIGNYAFAGCFNIKSITIPNCVRSIGRGALSNCSNIKNIVIPNSVVSIGYNAFLGCSSVENITIPFIDKPFNEVTNSPAFFYLFGEKFTDVPDSLKTVIISGGTMISDFSFVGCSKITKIIIPDTVTNIGTSAFANCTSLESLTIPNSVTSINSWAFENCSNLTNVAFEDPNGWFVTKTYGATSGTELTLNDPTQNATYLSDTYYNYYWYKSTNE